MENFIPYELAVKLKEKGFKTENTDWYYLDGNLAQVKKYINISPYKYAPTISQVLKWLREEKHKFVCIEFFNWEIGFGYKLVRLDYVSNITEKQRYKTYEQAALAGIEYIIDNDLI